jgi:hypothetical protein
MTTFHLSSPIMKGNAVKQLQRELRGKNAWNKNFDPGKIDGNYGPQTANAVLRAKLYLGYPKKKVNTTAGKRFQNFLLGKTPLPGTYKQRKKIRAKRLAKSQLRIKALNRMMERLGLAETPQGSNKNWLTRWWYRNDTPAPWCSISISEAYIHSGSKAFKRGEHYAYVPFLENAAARGDGMRFVTKDHVMPGDIVTFDFDGGVADHVGLFVKWISKANGHFEAVEGNTDAAGGAEGGEQLVKDRPMSQVSRFIRVNK